MVLPFQRNRKAASREALTYAHPTTIRIADLVAYRRYERALPLQGKSVRSLQSGNVRSPFRGKGMEFVEARPYQNGDDIRHLDWRLTARLGKPHSKIFQEERERKVMLWVDLHPRMFFATRGAFKAVVAAHAAALIAWNAAYCGHRVGGIITSPGEHVEVRPRRGKHGVLHFFRRMIEHPAWHDAYSEASSAAELPFVRLRRVVKSGSLIVLLSDMRGINSEAELQLRQMATHNDILLCHIHDLLETTLPPAGRYGITDGKRTTTLDTGSETFRRRYQEAFSLRREYLRALSIKQGLHLLSLPTDSDPVQVLRDGLGGRQ